MPEVNAVGNFACNACQHCMQAVNGGSASSHGVLPFRNAINRSGSGEILRSLPGPSLFVCACWLPDAAASSSVERQALPDGAPLHCSGRLSSVPTVPCLQQLRHGAAAAADSRWLSATAPRPATTPPQRPGQQQLRHSAQASNKPHLAAKSTPVWLAIWHIWAGFANSQHRDAAFATPKNICAHSSLLQH